MCLKNALRHATCNGENAHAQWCVGCGCSLRSGMLQGLLMVKTSQP